MLVLAGMGGDLISRILAEAPWLEGGDYTLILQPQSEYGQLRTFLRDSGFVIEDEAALEEEGKFYFLMKTVYKPQAAGSLNEAEAEFGPILLKRRDETLRTYLEKQVAINEEIISELNKQEEKMSILRRAEEVRCKIGLIKKALGDYYEMQ